MATHETQKRTLLTIMRTCAFHRKMADHMYGFQRSSAGSQQWRCFRENPTNFFTLLPAEYVIAVSGQTDAPEVRCDSTDRQTHRTKYCNPGCACTPMVNYSGLLLYAKFEITCLSVMCCFVWICMCDSAQPADNQLPL